MKVLHLAAYGSHRYCQVGTFLKNPKYPIFVVSSGDHLTVLFGSDRSLVQRSFEERLMDQVRLLLVRCLFC